MTTLYVADGYVASGYYQTGISIDWLQKIIFVPQSFLTYNGGVSNTLDTNAFRIALRDIEDNEDGAPQPVTHNHNTTVLLGGIEYARVIEILAPYTITFEETGTPYSVALSGSNNNILDRTNLGTVQILSSNSAGLVNVNTGSGLSVEQSAQLLELYQIHGLELGSPLAVTATSRTAASVSQTISDGAGTTTVTRT